jgi:hypothetical protein
MTPQEKLDDVTTNYGDVARRVNNDIRQLGNDVAELLTETTKLKGIMATPEQVAGVQSLIDGLNSLKLPEPVVVPEPPEEAAAPKKPAHASASHGPDPGKR